MAAILPFLLMAWNFATSAFKAGLAIFNSLWATETGRIIVVAVGVGLGMWVWGFNHGRAGRDEAIAAAVSARDVQWKDQIAKSNAEASAEADRRVAEALEAAKAVKPTPTDSAALAKLCKADANCRKAVK